MIRRFIFALAAIFMTSVAMANDTWKVKGLQTDPENTVIALLIRAFKFHMDPAATWYLEQIGPRRVSHDTFHDFRRSMTKATFGVFEYTYTRKGEDGEPVSYTRIYYAMSGPADPYTGFGLAARPLRDYIQSGPLGIHAYISPHDRSSIHSTEVQGDSTATQHQRDAELKAVRTIERDIQANIVPRGGRLQAFISQPMCNSCEHVMHEFERQYGVTINITHLEGNYSRAYESFRRQIEDYLDSVYLLVYPSPNRLRGPTPPPPSAGACAALSLQYAM
jgi:hypothetical protein